IYWRKNNPVKTLRYIQQAVTIFDTLPPKKEFALALTGIALIYAEMKQPVKAEELYEKILKIYQKILPIQVKEKDFYGVASSFLNIGSIFVDRSETDSALTYLNKSIEIAKQYNFKKVLALAYSK